MSPPPWSAIWHSDSRRSGRAFRSSTSRLTPNRTATIVANSRSPPDSLPCWLGFSRVGHRGRDRRERDAHGDDPSPGAPSNQVQCHRSAWISRASRQAATTRCDGDGSECGPHPACLGDEGTRGKRGRVGLFSRVKCLLRPDRLRRITSLAHVGQFEETDNDKVAVRAQPTHDHLLDG